jgi:hypothetical protein
MVGSSKILTVSYGTFSCTLEGFDEPFSTMKSIAEYFRDLAADDRYFGAEPPTPDAEMLHRIAEREVKRRVEARTSGTGIVLRQIEDSGEDAPGPHGAPVAASRDSGRPMSEESVASKLSRIRAVVDRARATSVAAHPVAAPTLSEAPLADYAEDEETALPADPAVDLEEDAYAVPAEMSADDAGPHAARSTAEDDEEDEEDDDAPRPWAGAPREDEETAVQGVDDRDDEDEDEDGDAQDDLSRRIIHLSHNGRGTTADEDDDEDDDLDGPAGLSDDDTLAGIRMALDAEQEALAQERKEARMERRHVLIGGDREPALDRILEETNSKMQDREGTRRRSAIAHLKAAVAATKADRLLKRERSREIDEEEQRDYREDLAKVVRPRRSEPRESAAEKARPKSIGSGAQPLILASSQRVDTPADEDPRADLRPRRVGAMIALDEEADLADDGLPEDDSEFVAFAEALGARDLPDLLEAAAAYTAFVERQPSFSRPQIMRRAAAIETDEEFTREAGLRSFGQLLRQGKIRKLQRGQFTISENTRFRPDARIAGE